MRFDEETAKALKERLGISQTTVRIWRLRGAIPDRYADEHYTPSERVTLEEGQAVANALRLQELSTKAICGGDDQLVVDWLAGKQTLDRKQYNRIRKTLLRIKKLITEIAAMPEGEIPTKKAMLPFETPEIVTVALLRLAADEAEAKRIRDAVRRKAAISPQRQAIIHEAFRLLAEKLKPLE